MNYYLVIFFIAVINTMTKATGRRKGLFGAFAFRRLGAHHHPSGGAPQQAGVATGAGAGS